MAPTLPQFHYNVQWRGQHHAISSNKTPTMQPALHFEGSVCVQFNDILTFFWRMTAHASAALHRDLDS